MEGVLYFGGLERLGGDPASVVSIGRRAGSEAGTPAMRGAGFTPKARTPLSGHNGSASVDTPSSGARQSPKERPSMIVEENAESSS